MAKNFKLNILIAAFIFISSFAFAQTPEPAKQEDEFANKKVETKITEVIPTDSLAGGELVKRAVAWIKVESLKYKKSAGTTTGTKVECVASFPVKPKELNPQVDYTGKVTMKVVIECKDSKYRYTISDIKHISKSGNVNGGSVDNVVPDCGSMGMNDIIWKRLKGEMMRGAGLVASDLKVGMSVIATDKKAEDEW
ncbi:hypothetical protein CNR22_17480 [Sphingobacteriaceae bacterium]|nr:hypothetical protein CNR22_17480 [Sphingobacteriaceae bacterium]